MKVKKRYYLLCGLGVLVYSVIQCAPYPKRAINPLFHKQKQPLVFAHGGSKLLFPENTIYAFEQAIAMGVDGIEVDVRKTSDDVLISMHDRDIAAYTKRKGAVHTYTYDELALFNFAYRFQNLEGVYVFRHPDEVLRKKLIPASIEGLFQRYQDDILYLLEIKERGSEGVKSASLLYDLIVQYRLEKVVCLAAFDQSVMTYLKSINTHHVSLVMDEKRSHAFVKANLSGYNRFMKYDMQGLMLPLTAQHIPLYEPYLVAKIHAQHLFVLYWTINDKKTMAMLLANGADGIISDRIDVALQLRDEMSK